MQKISLNGKWNVKGRPQGDEGARLIDIVGTVPGCVQLDLSENGILPSDLNMGLNILEAEKFENYEWWYECRFDAPINTANAYLVFEGVDCIAEYFLNGIKIGESDNMFIAHEFRVDSYLKDGENTLCVHISSPILEADKKEYNLKLLNKCFNYMESLHIRRAPHSYGWDIMPRAVTSGLWRGVSLEIRDEIYFNQIYFKAEGSKGTFFYDLKSDKHLERDIDIEIFGSCGDSTFYKKASGLYRVGSIDFEIESPKLWYPYGYGDANVYDATIRIIRGGNTISEKKETFGIRKIELIRKDATIDKKGSFRLKINDIDVMCLGSNWVPLDAFHSKDVSRLAEALSLASDIGCNILRCWGGNVYEDHEFFDYCDRHGIMIWQDFSMACAMYPNDDAFLNTMKKEVTAVIRKFRNHPSIVIWAGDNECDFFATPYNPDHNKITRELIPQIIEENDMGRPYIPSSPYVSGKEYELGIKSQSYGSPLGEEHLWGPRDYFKSDFYSGSSADFISETGYHGCPSMESIRKFITPDKVWPYRNNDEWTLHSCNQKGDESRVILMEDQIRQLFGDVPSDPDDYALASQISQAEADKYFIERIRIDRPRRTGVIWWNLLDGWPQMSDAVVGYYFDKKLAYHYIKRSQAPFMIAAGEISDWHLNIVACNNTLEKKNGHLEIIDTSDDSVIYSADFSADENTSTLLARLPIYFSEKKILIFKWKAENEEGFNHYLCGYPAFSFENYKRIIEKYNLRG